MSDMEIYRKLSQAAAQGVAPPRKCHSEILQKTVPST